MVKQEYEDIVKNEVQRAIAADEDAHHAAVRATTSTTSRPTPSSEKVKNKYTGQDEEPDERLMRSIEEKIDIPESRKDDFRREIMNYIGALAHRRQEVRLQDQRAAAEGARAEAVRGPEGHDQADDPGLERRRQGDAGEDRRRQGAPDPELRLRRRFGDRRAELRGQHLRPRRRQARQPLTEPDFVGVLGRARLSPSGIFLARRELRPPGNLGPSHSSPSKYAPTAVKLGRINIDGFENGDCAANSEFFLESGIGRGLEFAITYSASR